MYQFYYAKNVETKEKAEYKQDIRSLYEIESIRPTMWEEHCLECSAPLCFSTCPHYLARKDGRCMRFENGMLVALNPLGCGGQCARVKFKKWANMMSIIFPDMLETDAYHTMIQKNQIIGNLLEKVLNSSLPVKAKWGVIRCVEYMRRRGLKKSSGQNCNVDAFLFHSFSFCPQEYKLIIEFFSEHTPVYRMSLSIIPGENLYILDTLNPSCSKAGNLIKIYPENDLEAEIEILWCDFVKGKRVQQLTEKNNAQTKIVKCVVWDLDNTVWDGILIETDQPKDLKIRPGILELMRELDNRGVLQSIASKNDYETTWPVLEEKGIAEFILYPQIHWNAKSASIEQIARSLNIGIDSLALIDDSVFERNQVSSTFPEVRVYDVSEIDSLLQRSEFDIIPTQESRQRRSMYRAEEKRKNLQAASNVNVVDFIKQCHLKLTLFEPKTKEEIQRCFELVVRTNQLNMSGKKYSQEEFDSVIKRDGYRNVYFRCEDDYGSYGIVGFCQYVIENRILIFKEFAMSCRVAGKYVESALFSELLRKEKCAEGKFDISKTKKNSLLRRTLEEIGFEIQLETDERVIFKFDNRLLNKEVVSIVEQ